VAFISNVFLVLITNNKRYHSIKGSYIKDPHSYADCHVSKGQIIMS
jgi:hypothetical protein